jgi:peptide/nickel transport system permease protein
VFRSAVEHLVLPGLVLGSSVMGLITRVTRSSMLEVLGQDYVRTARAKGLIEHSVVLRHALRNALIPTVTVLGLAYGSLLSGAVMTETIFAWPGLGRYAYEAAISNDFPAILGVTFVIALMYILVNLIVDMVYALLDPQIRYA